MRCALSATLAALALGLAAAPAAGATGRFEAYFLQRSYGRAVHGELAVQSPSRKLQLQVFRAGAERDVFLGDDLMKGAPMGPPRAVRRARGGASVMHVWLGRWPSGLYFARLRDPGGDFAFAPVVLRANRRDNHRVAVVLPTNTWQAYNFRDGDHDGFGDTWYANHGVRTVDLRRPFNHRGVPPHYRRYDAPFERWLFRDRKDVDFLSDDDLERIPDARRLARRYDLVVFPGHEEYVTAHAYGLVERYVARGGNLMLLSANNFFSRVTRRGPRITRVGRWRDRGRAEARWLGSQYLDWNHDTFPNAPYEVVGHSSAPWLFADTGLLDGARFGSFGIEIDATTPFSPPGTTVLARIPDVFGPGRSAEMTYRESAAGAKVFAAGAIDFAGAADAPPVSQMLRNLWTRMSAR